jgi:hypothetical protein
MPARAQDVQIGVATRRSPRQQTVEVGGEDGPEGDAPEQFQPPPHDIVPGRVADLLMQG